MTKVGPYCRYTCDFCKKSREQFETDPMTNLSLTKELPEGWLSSEKHGLHWCGACVPCPSLEMIDD